MTKERSKRTRKVLKPKQAMKLRFPCYTSNTEMIYSVYTTSELDLVIFVGFNKSKSNHFDKISDTSSQINRK